MVSFLDRDIKKIGDKLLSWDYGNPEIVMTSDPDEPLNYYENYALLV